MKQTTQGVVVVAVGALLLWLASGDLMLRLVLPSFRVPLLLAGSVMCLLGVATFVSSRSHHRVPKDDDALRGAEETHDHGGHRHAPGTVPRIGLLLLAPVLIALAFGVRPLGARAEHEPGSFLSSIRTVSPRSTTTIPPDAQAGIDLTAPVIDTSLSWVTAAPLTDPDAPELRQRVRLVGYVDGVTDAGFVVSRYSITCCVADAKVLSIDVVGAADVRPGDWVEVVGTYLAPPPGADLHRVSTRSGLIATEPPRVIDEPPDPYEH